MNVIQGFDSSRASFPLHGNSANLRSGRFRSFYFSRRRHALSLPVFKRAFLWMGGVRGDRARGMNQLHKAADHGRYLRPLAKVILALAYEREHQPDHARQLLAELVAEFPSNPLLFSHELALLDQRTLRRRGELLPVG
jgi:hypothetical protein